MGPSIIDTTRRFIAELDADTLAEAEAAVREQTRLDIGRELRLQEALELLTLAKVLALTEDFQRGEAQGLRLWLSKYEMPGVVLQHLIEVDISGCSLDELKGRLPADGIETRRFYWWVAALACFEGLRQGSRARAELLAHRLGLPSGLARVLLEEAQIAVSAIIRGDEPLIRRLRQLRYAIFELET